MCARDSKPCRRTPCVPGALLPAPALQPPPCWPGEGGGGGERSRCAGILRSWASAGWVTAEPGGTAAGNGRGCHLSHTQEGLRARVSPLAAQLVRDFGWTSSCSPGILAQTIAMDKSNPRWWRHLLADLDAGGDLETQLHRALVLYPKRYFCISSSPCLCLHRPALYSPAQMHRCTDGQYAPMYTFLMCSSPQSHKHRHILVLPSASPK